MRSATSSWYSVGLLLCLAGSRVLEAQSVAVTAVLPRQETYPTLSPNGQYILYSADSAGILSLNRLDLATREIRRLTRTGADDSAASWAPDGSRIVFQRAVSWAMGGRALRETVPASSPTA